MKTLKALAALLGYPTPALIDALPDIAAVIAGEPLLGGEERARLRTLVDELAQADLYESEARYVDLFDRGRATSLHLFEHIHGDTRDRGQAMVDLGALYARGGLVLAPNELPDFLPAVLEYLSTRPLAEGREMLGDCAHVLRAVGEALAARESRYSAVFGALLAIAGEAALDDRPRKRAAAPVKDDLDAEWVDAPVVFGPGCGDIKPKAQVVRFVNRTA